MKRFTLAIALLFSISATAQIVPDYEKLSAHPRLILKSGDIEAVRRKINDDSALKAIHNIIEERANNYMLAEPCKRTQTGRRLLTISRKVLERVCYCSYMYLIDGDEMYARRAEKEMLAAADFSDWNPSHFLDVGEMTAAMALGYDWLYDWLSPKSRAIIEDAIIEKGLRTAKPNMWWYRADNNWNQVCNGGMIMGALAVYERIPEEAQIMIERSLKGNPKAQTCYAPDGVYPEGFGYWEYGTWYEVLLIESLRTALGTSFGLEKYPGFLESAKFMNFMQAPSGEVFNFADSGNPLNTINPLLYWFALETSDMSLVWQDRKRLLDEEQVRGINRHTPIAMLFAARCNTEHIYPIKDNFWAGVGKQPLFIYRSGFESEQDCYLAAKGGSPSSNHAHMDSGSFIFEWGGVRWASDLGSQNYNSLESKGVKLWSRGQNSQRWRVFRLNNYPHNTLTINDELHLVNGMATITKIYDSKGKHGAQFEMTSLLPQLSKATRTLYIDKEDKVTCIDLITAKQTDCNVRWNMTTTTTARIINNQTISLTKDGKEVIMRIVAPKSAKAYIKDNNPPESYDAPNKGSWRVGFECLVAAGKTQAIKVELIPQR